MKSITPWLQDFSKIEISNKNKDIYLKEYDHASKQLELEERIFSNTVALSSFLITIFISLFLTNSNKVKNIINSLPNINTRYVLIFIVFTTMLFSIMALKYFAKKQRSIIYSRRKVVIIRGIMNCYYHDFSSILPNWTVHGANNPFSIKSQLASNYFIFWLIALTSSILVFQTSFYIVEPSITKPFFLITAGICFIIIRYSFSEKPMELCNYLSIFIYFITGVFLYNLIKFNIISNQWARHNTIFCLMIITWLSLTVEAALYTFISISRFVNKTALISAIFFLTIYSPQMIAKDHSNSYFIPILLALFWFLSCWAIFQKYLFDSFENFYLFFGKFFAFILDYKLHWNMTFKVYEAIMATNEIKRHRVSLTTLKKITVQIEDKRFLSRQDILDYRSLIRILYIGVFKSTSYIPAFMRRWYDIPNSLNKHSGGSTISQQLFRTLFSAEKSLANKKVRRKILELYFSYWLETIFPDKDDLLSLYLASVRYEKGCHGVPAAIKYFFGDSQFFILDNFVISPAKAFFLTERLSNSQSKLHFNKIKTLAIDLKTKKILNDQDLIELRGIYIYMISNKKIKPLENFDMASLNDLK